MGEVVHLLHEYSKNCTSIIWVDTQSKLTADLSFNRFLIKLCEGGYIEALKWAGRAFHGRELALGFAYPKTQLSSQLLQTIQSKAKGGKLSREGNLTLVKLMMLGSNLVVEGNSTWQ